MSGKLIWSAVLVSLLGLMLQGAAAEPSASPAPDKSANAKKARRASPAGPVHVKKAEAPKPRPSKTPAVGEEAILKALDGQVSLDFADKSLADVAAFLQDSSGILIQFDHKALDEVGVATDTAITRTLPGVTLRSALDLILRDLGLTWTIRSEVLLITSLEVAESMLVTKVYEVGDLVMVHFEQGATDDDFDSLIDLITSSLVPTTWDSVGGPGSIAPSTVGAARVLVISQTWQNHEAIARLLKDLRQAMKACGDKQPPVRPRPPAGATFGGMGGMGMWGMGGMGVAGSGKAAPGVERAKPSAEKTPNGGDEE